MITSVIPSIIDKSIDLDGMRHLGLAARLTTFQTRAKKSWRILAKRHCSQTDYGTDVKKWVCQCGVQQLQAEHLCKHLVHAVHAHGPLPSDFFENLS
jgi:hypothetical protein